MAQSTASPSPMTMSCRARSIIHALLTATYFSSFADRQILSILQGHIKVNLALSDTHLGRMLTALMNYAFVGWCRRYMQRSLGLSMRDIARYIAIPCALLGVGLRPLILGQVSDILGSQFCAESFRFSMLLLAFAVPGPIYHCFRARQLMRRGAYAIA